MANSRVSGLPVHGIIFLGKIILTAHRSSFHPHSEKTLTEFEYFALAQIVRSLMENPEIVCRTVGLSVCLDFGPFSSTDMKICKL